ncbi:MAG: glycosyltransferase family 4 protein, partial [Bdellovibrionales bacterium]|nr:glycosyltransferase family 4 protein [Bdellovibrionales bacterium]
YALGLNCVAKTEFLAGLLRDRHGVGANVIRPGIDRTVFYPGEQHEFLGRPRLAALFRSNTSRRGASELIEILRALRTRVPELEVSLFGDDDGLPEDLSGWVKLTGKLTQEQVAELYRNSDLVLDPSYWHGFGRMGIEGMACGAVPVLSRSGGIDRYARDAENSLLFSSENWQEAVEKIAHLSSDSSYRLDLRQAALKTASEFSEIRATLDWISVLGLEQPKQSYVLLLEELLSPSSKNVMVGDFKNIASAR